MPAREALLSRTFVQLADTLVDEFDIIDLLTVLTDRCVELLGAAAAGILLADHEGGLHVMAASSEQVRLLELFQLQNQQWPRFAPMALAAGFCAVHALPMRLRDNVIGALNVFMGDRLVVTDDDLLIAQALADASTIAILQDQAVREAQVVANQLNGALTSRIAIEQAKGILAERAEIDMQEAFSRLRRYARDHNRQLSLVATELINGTLPGAAIANLSRHDQRELTK